MPDIFISYAREDRDTAERLAHALEDEGWAVWWDRHIPAGKRFDEVITSNLDSARCVVVLWSQAGIASQWVAEEAEEGRERGALVPAMIEAVEPPLGFRRIHAADLVGWDGNPAHPGLRQMIGDICQIMSAPASPSATVNAASASVPASRTGAIPRRRRLPLILGGATLLTLLAVGAATLIGWHSTERTATSRKITVEYESGDAGKPDATAIIDGRWRGTVAYDWGPKIDETFTFRTLGDTLTGSAGFLGVARGFVDAAQTGRTLRFAVRWQETLGSEQRQVTNRYVGNVDGERIDMVLTIDGGFTAHPPIDFTLVRVAD